MSLFESFISKENFILAYKRIATKRKSGGIDQISIEEFSNNLEKNIQKLRQKIIDQTYIPDPVKSIHIPKFNEKDEWRELGLPTVADKIVQAALLQVVEPLAEKMFMNTSYGYRTGKGPFKAIRRVEHNIKNLKLCWVIHQDIDNFFDSLNHDYLIKVFSNLVEGDQRLVELVAMWCRMGIVAKSGKWKNVEAGVRQGQVISPLLANLYLHKLDEFVEDKGWGWVRYADDYLLQSKDKQEILEADKLITLFLKEELNLKLNKNPNPVSHINQGFEFLGVYFQGDEKRISSKKIQKMKQKIKWFLKARSNPETLISRLNESLDGWKRYYSFLEPKEQFSMLDQLVQDKFIEIAKDKIARGYWPSNPPAEIGLISLLDKTNCEKEAQKRLAKLWKMAKEAGQIEQIKKKADYKVGKKRKTHKKRHIESGEVFVTSPGHFIGKRTGCIVIRKKQKIVSELPLIKLKGLTIAGHAIALSSDVIRTCYQNDVYLHFIDELGRVFATINYLEGMNAQIVIKQLELRNSEKGLSLAKMFILGKLKNQLALIKSYTKYRGHNNNEKFKVTYEALRPKMESILLKIKDFPIDTDTEHSKIREKLMGLEGTFGSNYWHLIQLLLPEEVNFTKRHRKGATDLVNSLLNYGYGILYSKVIIALLRAKLNPTIGFLHTLQKDKPALAFDLIEEFRAPVVDRTVFSMLNRRMSLSLDENGLLEPDTRKKLAKAIVSRLGNEVSYRGRKLTLFEILNKQALAIQKYLINNISYRPFLSKW